MQSRGPGLTRTGSFSLAYGPAPSYLLSTDFTVTPGDPPAPALEPVPSGSLQKKRRNNQHVFDCPIGHTWCWTGQGQDYACMDTSSDVSGKFLSPLLPYSCLVVNTDERSLWTVPLCSRSRESRLYFDRRG